MRLRISMVLLALTALSSSSMCSAATIASNTAGNGAGNTGYVGQSFTIASGTNYDDITFAFLGSSSQNIASGTGYLFSSAYTGLVSALSPSDAGVLGTATVMNGVYTFASALTLTAGSTYYFYENAALVGVFGGNSYTGGQAYFANANTNGFEQQGVSNDFKVTGDAVAVTPEPSSFVLLGTGALGIVGVLKRRLLA